MQRITLLLVLISSLLGCTTKIQRPDAVISFDTSWRFHLGESDSAHFKEFNGENWRKLNVPHDWSIEGEYNQENPSGSLGGYLPTGIGWYRKTFAWDPLWKDKQVFIQFDGVYMNSEVWINGHYLGKRPYGYVPFQYNLTPHLNAGDNVLSVKVDNSLQPNSRWYTGSGIYRHVWLAVKDQVAFAHNSTFITTTEVNSEQAMVNAAYEIANSTDRKKRINVVSEILDAKGKIINTTQKAIEVNEFDTARVALDISLPSPLLWSPEHPNLYRLQSHILIDGDKVETEVKTFGVRTIRFDSETGFWLNDENIKVKGVNNHQDAGPVGVAVPEDVLLRRLLLLKEMGANAIRTAHHPFAPEFYDMCDSLGFLVMDEVFDEWIDSWPWETDKEDQGKVPFGYNLYFEEWHKRDLRDVIRRDRNHPSVFMWSIGNEIPDQCYPEGPQRLKRLMEIVKEEDTTRPITAGCCFIHLANETGFSSLLDVTGYNGGGGSVFYEKDKAAYPDRKFIATEIPHTFQTRGVYKTKSYMRSPNQGVPVPDLTSEEVFVNASDYYSSSYDNSSVRLSARDSWRRTDSLSYVSGEFRWTGFDYLGESNLGWPARFFNFGILDLCGFPKDTYYFYKSQWTTEPMVHILPHWTWPDLEGKTIPVWVYANTDSVELFLNDQSLGKKKMKGKMNLEWQVPYTPGVIKAVGTTNGKVVTEAQQVTSGKPSKIELSVDKESITPDGVSCIHIEAHVLDENGNLIPYANNLINFDINGPAQIIGVENGDPLDHSPHKVNYRKAFNGMCLAIIQSNGQPGEIVIEASAEGLQGSRVELVAE
ncbi:MAG: glycoside hydrolase family 2 TIM barrel-domain containing protein [Bacteroidota bacterium]